MKLGVHGRHNVLNALAAASAAYLLGLPGSAVEEGLAPRMPEPEYLSMVGAGCISGILLRCALSEAPQETFAAAMEDTRKIYLAALQ